jgi:hypothetical protein
MEHEKLAFSEPALHHVSAVAAQLTQGGSGNEIASETFG